VERLRETRRLNAAVEIQRMDASALMAPTPHEDNADYARAGNRAGLFRARLS
jgi:hypothetical protein